VLRRLIVTANVVPNSPILAMLMMEALVYFKTSVLSRATLRNIAEDDILHITCLLYLNVVSIRKLNTSYLIYRDFRVTLKGARAGNRIQ
jgi:hypothetical protein